MDTDKEIKELKEAEQQRRSYPLCYCWPTSDSGFGFWGLFLVIVGGVWLLSSLGIAAAIAWSLLFLAPGIFYLSQSRVNHQV